MRNKNLDLLLFFGAHYLFMLALVFIFDLLISLCFLPIGFGFTVLGYLLNGIGIIVCGVSSGMILLIVIRKTGINERSWLWMLPVFAAPVFLSLRFIFHYDADLSLLFTLPGILIALLICVFGKKLLKENNRLCRKNQMEY
jgi:hypothetical protein